MNQTLKNILTKLALETQWNWVKCLPLALLRIRTRPRTDLGVSPYEMLFELPFLLIPYSTGEHLEGGTAMQKYIETVTTTTLEELRKKGYLPQTSPLNCKIHAINLGDSELIKSQKRPPLTAHFEGPFQVLLTTNQHCSENKGAGVDSCKSSEGSSTTLS